MQAYHDDQTEQWLESPRAMEMLEKLERLSEIADELQSLEEPFVGFEMLTKRNQNQTVKKSLP